MEPLLKKVKKYYCIHCGHEYDPELVKHHRSYCSKECRIARRKILRTKGPINSSRIFADKMIGYTKDEITKAYNAITKRIDILTVVPCKCNNICTCYPHQLNTLRDNFGLSTGNSKN